MSRTGNVPISHPPSTSLRGGSTDGEPRSRKAHGNESVGVESPGSAVGVLYPILPTRAKCQVLGFRVLSDHSLNPDPDQETDEL